MAPQEPDDPIEAFLAELGTQHQTPWTDAGNGSEGEGTMGTETAKTLLTWEEGRFSGFDGLAGKIHLFSIHWRTVRTGKNWKMRTELPGFTGKQWEADEREELYAAAEKFLAAWIGRVSKGPGSESSEEK